MNSSHSTHQQPRAIVRARTYSYARANLAKLWDEIEDSQASLRIRRRGHRDMALIPADELESLQETVHLLRSPKNATRLLSALARSENRAARPIELTELCRRFGVDSGD